MRKSKLQLGDIYQIPLSNGKYAYARLYREYTIAVYKGEYISYTELPYDEDYSFFVGVYKDILQDGEWKVIDRRPFASQDDAWAPPMCVKSSVYNKYSIYSKGETIPSTEEACKGLEHVAAWDRNHVVDRIMGIDKWNPK